MIVSLRNIDHPLKELSSCHHVPTHCHRILRGHRGHRASVTSQDVFIIRAADSRTMDSGHYGDCGDQSEEHPAAGQGLAPQLKTQ